MIVISTYNPQVPRQTEDEELLTTLLTSLIVHRVYCAMLTSASKNQVQENFNEAQTKNCDKLIQLVYPLLGLSSGEVYDLIRMEEHRCQIDHTGKK